MSGTLMSCHDEPNISIEEQDYRAKWLGEYKDNKKEDIIVVSVNDTTDNQIIISILPNNNSIYCSVSSDGQLSYTGNAYREPIRDFFGQFKQPDSLKLFWHNAHGAHGMPVGYDEQYNCVKLK